MKIIVLGSGNSAGTPGVGNYWGDCDPAEPKNRRTRPSIAVRTEKTTLIVDTGPDFREQMNREDIQSLDAVLFTHAHSDHIAGIDDLRSLFLRTRKLTPVYGNQETIDEIMQRFEYLFIERAKIYPKVLEHRIIERGTYNQPMTIGDITFVPFEQNHGTCMSLGFRFGDVAYSTDVVDLDQQALETLNGIRTWIVDAAAFRDRVPAHFTLEQVYEMNSIVQAEKVYLTHLTPAMDYNELGEELPDGFDLAWDGLRIDAG